MQIKQILLTFLVFAGLFTAKPTFTAEQSFANQVLKVVKNNKGQLALASSAIAAYYFYKKYGKELKPVIHNLKLYESMYRSLILALISTKVVQRLSNSLLNKLLKDLNLPETILVKSYYLRELVVVYIAFVFVALIYHYHITTKLQTAIDYNNNDSNLNYIKFLTYAGANYNNHYLVSLSALSLATQKNQLKTIEYFLSKFDCLVDAEDSNGKTALSYALENNNLPIIKLLIKNEALLDKAITKIDITCLSNEVEAYVFQITNKINLLLFMYTQKRNLNRVKELIALGANPNIKNVDTTALVHAAQKKYYEICRELLKFNGPTKFLTPNNPEDDVCPICHCTGELYPTVCKHYFHAKCLADNIAIGNITCPICMTEQ